MESAYGILCNKPAGLGSLGLFCLSSYVPHIEFVCYDKDLHYRCIYVYYEDNNNDKMTNNDDLEFIC